MRFFNIFCIVSFFHILISALAVIFQSNIMFVILILMHFLAMRMIPMFRHGENVWMFLLVACSFIPVNIYLLVLILINEYAHSVNISFFEILVSILDCILYYTVMFGVEQIVMGSITRLIWKKQKRFIP